MDIPKDIYNRITQKHGTVLDLKSNPAILDDILRDLRSIEQDDFSGNQKKAASPFNVPWLDSWAANWLQHQQSQSGQSQKEVDAVLGQMIDVKFRERLSELKRFIGGITSPTPPPDDLKAPPPPDPEDPDASFYSSPPPPDPGFFATSPQPPDPNDLRAPPPPDPEDPDASVYASPPPPDPNDFRAPPPPDPEDPDASVYASPPTTGTDAAALRDNPWVLYWFISINAPLILNMIDAHISRRLNDLKMQTRKK